MLRGKGYCGQLMLGVWGILWLCLFLERKLLLLFAGARRIWKIGVPYFLAAWLTMRGGKMFPLLPHCNQYVRAFNCLWLKAGAVDEEQM